MYSFAWLREFTHIAIPFVLAIVPLQAETLAGLITLAFDRNGELQAMRTRAVEARALVRQAGLRPNPNLEASYANGPVFGSTGETDFTVGVSQTVETGGKRQRRISVAEAELRDIEWQIADRERLLRTAIASAFADWLALSSNEANARRLLELTRQGLALVTARVKEGEAAALEQSLLQVESNRTQADLIIFTSQRERARLTLLAVAGVSDAEAPPLSDDFQTFANSFTGPLSQDEEIAAALRSRPDLAALRAAEQTGDRAIELEKSNARPSVTAFSRFSHSHQQSDAFGYVTASPVGALIPVSDQDNIITGGINIALPFKNRNQGNIEAAVARKDGARLRRAYLEQSIQREVRSALIRLSAARQASELFGQDVVALAEKNLAVIRKSYELGELRLLDVINEQRRFVELQRTYTETLKERVLAQIELDRARGAGKP
jgi:cobalt-zinc-cadmium efflux system outer membrane protein